MLLVIFSWPSMVQVPDASASTPDVDASAPSGSLDAPSGSVSGSFDMPSGDVDVRGPDADTEAGGSSSGGLASSVAATVGGALGLSGKGDEPEGEVRITGSRIIMRKPVMVASLLR